MIVLFMFFAFMISTCIPLPENTLPFVGIDIAAQNKTKQKENSNEIVVPYHSYGRIEKLKIKHTHTL